MAKDDEVEEVAALKQHLQGSKAKWRAGATSLSALSKAEKQARLGWVPPPGEPTPQERERVAKAKHAAKSPSASDPAPPSDPAPTPTTDPAPAPTTDVAGPPAREAEPKG